MSSILRSIAKISDLRLGEFYSGFCQSIEGYGFFFSFFFNMTVLILFSFPPKFEVVPIFYVTVFKWLIIKS